MIRHKKVLIIPVLVIAAAAAVWFFKTGKRETPLAFETAIANIGSVASTISATGTVEPVDEVEVGTQVSGVVKKIYVDYNSTVRKGQLLAELDKTTLKAALDLSNVSLKSAKIELDHLKKKYERINKLFEKSMVSQEELDQARYDLNRGIVSVEKAEAEVERAKLNLSYATIYSPIDGTVLSRSVDEGQTVAASLNAPTLFTIAQDLMKMEVYASVDEADIGQVKQKQRVTFTVDAYPEETFNGTVSQVRLEPTVTSNVVTYTVTILAQNPELKLMPGMTATITVYLQEASNVLTIPAKALRFKPDEQLLSRFNMPEHSNGKMLSKERNGQGQMLPQVSEKSSTNNEFGRPGPSDFKGARAGKNKTNWKSKKEKDTGIVWVKDDKQIRPVRIKTGLSDNVNVQVTDGLKEGDEVILSVKLSSSSKVSVQNSESVNPFMPKRPARGSRIR